MPGTLVLVLLAMWVGAIAVLVYADLADRFLWVPVLLAITGVFASILPLAMPPNIAMVVNAATLTLFILSVQVSKPKRRLPITVMRQGSRGRRRSKNPSSWSIVDSIQHRQR
jgi:hypothetical protein